MLYFVPINLYLYYQKDKTKDKDYLAVSPRTPKKIELERTKNLVKITGKDGNYIWNITTEMSELII